MLKEFYESFTLFIEDSKKNILKILDLIKNDRNIELFNSYQDYIISFGNVLEIKYGFEGNEIIHRLEDYCEWIYEIGKGQAKVDEDAMRDKIISIIDDIYLTKSERECHTSIVLIAKDEDEDIEEWLEYHMLMGIEHFYIYDNDSKDSFKKVLEPYIKEGIVTYKWFPGPLMQLEAYNHAITNYKHDTRYMAFIDADEFIVSMDGRSIPELVEEIINDYENGTYKIPGSAAGIGLNWRNYGTSGYEDRPQGLLTSTHVMRTRDDNEVNCHIKVICNPRAGAHFDYTPHNCLYDKGYYTISENGSYIPNAFFFDSRCDKLRINHYYMKSASEFYAKLKRGWPIWKQEDPTDEWIDQMYRGRVDECNQVEDSILVKYADQIQERINMRRGAIEED